MLLPRCMGIIFVLVVLGCPQRMQTFRCRRSESLHACYRSSELKRGVLVASVKRVDPRELHTEGLTGSDAVHSPSPEKAGSNS